MSLVNIVGSAILSVNSLLGVNGSNYQENRPCESAPIEFKPYKDPTKIYAPGRQIPINDYHDNDHPMVYNSGHLGYVR